MFLVKVLCCSGERCGTWASCFWMWSATDLGTRNSNCIWWKVVSIQIKFWMQSRIEFSIKTVHNLYQNNTWWTISIVVMGFFLFLLRIWQNILNSFSKEKSNYLTLNENFFFTWVMMLSAITVKQTVFTQFWSLNIFTCLALAPISFTNWWWKVLWNEEWLMKETLIA